MPDGFNSLLSIIMAYLLWLINKVILKVRNRKITLNSCNTMDTSQDKDGKTDLFAVATSTVSFQEDVKEVPILLCTFHCLNSKVF